MELKLSIPLLYVCRESTFNRTAYGIEILQGVQVCSLMYKLLIAPLMELKLITP